jgi:hypothetical protein
LNREAPRPRGRQYVPPRSAMAGRSAIDSLGPRAAPPRDALSRRAGPARGTAYRSALLWQEDRSASGGDGATKVDGDHRGKRSLDCPSGRGCGMRGGGRGERRACESGRGHLLAR